MSFNCCHLKTTDPFSLTNYITTIFFSLVNMVVIHCLQQSLILKICFFSHIDSDGFPILQMTLAIIKSCLDLLEKK